MYHEAFLCLRTAGFSNCGLLRPEEERTGIKPDDLTPFVTMWCIHDQKPAAAKAADFQFWQLFRTGRST